MMLVWRLFQLLHQLPPCAQSVSHTLPILSVAFVFQILPSSLLHSPIPSFILPLSFVLPPLTHSYTAQTRDVKKADVQYLLRYLRLAWTSVESSTEDLEEEGEEGETAATEAGQGKISKVYSFDQDPVTALRERQHKYLQIEMVLDLLWDLFIHADLRLNHIQRVISRVEALLQQRFSVATTPSTPLQPMSASQMRHSASTFALSARPRPLSPIRRSATSDSPHSSTPQLFDINSINSHTPPLITPIRTSFRSVVGGDGVEEVDPAASEGRRPGVTGEAAAERAEELQRREEEEKEEEAKENQIVQQKKEQEAGEGGGGGAGEEEDVQQLQQQGEVQGSSSRDQSFLSRDSLHTQRTLDEEMDEDAVWAALEAQQAGKVPSNLILLPAIIESLKHCRSMEQKSHKLHLLRQLFANHPSLSVLVVHDIGWHRSLFELLTDIPLHNEVRGGEPGEVEENILGIMTCVILYSFQHSTGTGSSPAFENPASASPGQLLESELSALQLPGVLALFSSIFSDLRAFQGGWAEANLEIARRLLERTLAGLLEPTTLARIQSQLNNPAISVATQRWRAVFELVAVVLQFCLFTGTDVVVPGDIRLRGEADGSDEECPFDMEQLYHILSERQLILEKADPAEVLADKTHFEVSLQGSLKLHSHPITKTFEDLRILHSCGELLDLLGSDLEEPPVTKKQISLAAADFQSCISTALLAQTFFHRLVTTIDPEHSQSGFSRRDSYHSYSSRGMTRSSLLGNGNPIVPRRVQMLESLVGDPSMGHLSAALRHHCALTSRMDEQLAIQEAQQQGGGSDGSTRSSASSSSTGGASPTVYVGPDGQVSLKSGPVVTLLASGGFSFLNFSSHVLCFLSSSPRLPSNVLLFGSSFPSIHPSVYAWMQMRRCS